MTRLCQIILCSHSLLYAPFREVSVYYIYGFPHELQWAKHVYLDIWQLVIYFKAKNTDVFTTFILMTRHVTL